MPPLRSFSLIFPNSARLSHTGTVLIYFDRRSHNCGFRCTHNADKVRASFRGPTVGRGSALKLTWGRVSRAPRARPRSFSDQRKSPGQLFVLIINLAAVHAADMFDCVYFSHSDASVPLISASDQGLLATIVRGLLNAAFRLGLGARFSGASH